MPSNSRLHQAKASKNDEFYTQLSYIENEIKYYRSHFKDKVVLCNCDDPRVSNFFRYFSLNFETLGLKRLIATCYKNCEPDLFTQQECERAVYIIYDGDKNGNRVPDPSEMEVHQLKGDGDFRSQECIELLKQADIVCTNPPFSLFREYIAQLLQYQKKFIVIGNIGAVNDKDIFPLIRDNKFWVGVTNFNVGMMFIVPDSYEKYHHIDENGNKVARVSTSCWWTNIENKRKNEKVILVNKYSESAYKKYDNYDAIEIPKYQDIPYDYDGVMGVPSTFIGHYNPDQFELLGISNSSKENAPKGIWRDTVGSYIDGKKTYSRLFIKRK